MQTFFLEGKQEKEREQVRKGKQKERGNGEETGIIANPAATQAANWISEISHFRPFQMF